VRGLVNEAGLVVENVDATVITERPLIAPASAAIRERLAGALGISESRVSVKGTRGEGLGPEGRGECVTVQAVALLRREASS